MSWADVESNCGEIMTFIRNLIDWIYSFLTDSSMYKNLSDAVTANNSVFNIGTVIKSTALTICVLLFLIDFFQKSTHLQWVTWENILMFFMKLFLAKIFINNAGGLLAMIQNGFASILDSALDENATLGFRIFPLGLAGVGTKDVGYFLQGTALSNALDPSDAAFKLNLEAGFYNIGITIIGLIMKVVFIMAAVIVIARMFELLVYTAIAPIPLATLACEGLQDVGKGFLKSFAAVCLQAVVIVLMILVFGIMISNKSILHLDKDSISTPIFTLLMTFIFGAGIMQSGNWAKKFCGAM